jgi:hypothetical protein
VTPGTILFDSSFVFKDKQVGEKLIVVLNDGTDGYYILVKTTSVPDNKEKKIGCNLTNKKYPNFFIEKKTCGLPKDTWVALFEFYPYSTDEILNKHFRKQLEIKCTLPREILLKLLECCIICNDISGLDRKILMKTHDNL